MLEPHDAGQSVRSVERAIAILRCFSFDEELRLSQICERVELPKSTVHRLIASLEQAHFIEQDPETGKYCLGFEVIRLGKLARFNKALCRMVHPELAILAAKTGQTSNLYIAHGYDRLCIDQVEGSEYVRRYSFMGALHPMHCGASGRVLLAYSIPEFQKEYLACANLKKVTPKTETDPQKLSALWEKTRQDGYAFSMGERDSLSGSIAVPLFDTNDMLIAAITVSGPLTLFTPENVSAFKATLLESQKRLIQKFRV